MLNFLYNPIAWALLQWHNLFALIFGERSGWSWGLAIIFLTFTVRVILFPLFIKQIRSQRVMTQLQPEIKKLQARYKDDKQRLSEETMKLYKDHKANPLGGCLPMLVQMPFFWGIFHVFRSANNSLAATVNHHVSDLTSIPQQFQHLCVAASGGGYNCPVKLPYGGWSLADTVSMGNARIFGAPIASGIHSTTSQLVALGSPSKTVVIVVCLVFILLSGLSSFLTQWQMLRRNKAMGTATGVMLTQQKLMLYVLPLGIMASNIIFPWQIGLLMYWCTTNVWTLGQQHFVIGSMDKKAAKEEEEKRLAKMSGPKLGQFPGRTPPKSKRRPAAAGAGGAIPAGAAAVSTETGAAVSPAGNGASHPGQGPGKGKKKGQRPVAAPTQTTTVAPVVPAAEAETGAAAVPTPRPGQRRTTKSTRAARKKGQTGRRK